MSKIAQKQELERLKASEKAGKMNLHTHSFRCKHATGDIDDYTKCAEEAGLRILGFSDHTPLPDGRWDYIRMNLEEFKEYDQAISLAQSNYPQMRILKGLECEYFPEYHPFYQDYILGECHFDYIIGSTHFFSWKNKWKTAYEVETPEQLKQYTDNLIKAMESGLFLFMAHPDVFATAYLNWDANAQACSKDILEAAEALNVPLEINGLGFRRSPVGLIGEKRYPYPLASFWELAAQYNISVFCNSDAHNPEDVGKNIQDAINIAEALKIPLKDLDARLAEITSTQSSAT
ncbi:MAG: histidinol-phosphatase [Planctomycetes bacterium]|nr:histidinol-phosphatase [Planctomycetota bacterium]